MDHVISVGGRPPLPDKTRRIPEAENFFTHPLLEAYDPDLFFSWAYEAEVWYIFRLTVQHQEATSAGGIVMPGTAIIPGMHVQMIWDTDERGPLNIEKAIEELRATDPYLRDGSVYENFKKIMKKITDKQKRDRKEHREAQNKELDEELESCVVELTSPQKFYDLTTTVTEDLEADHGNTTPICDDHRSGAASGG